ncbi:hypothetical protein HY085_00390 [Candidatus Gottesmanbacteria bacterium]|nr:hypothetical protein [Candidatus Gottesmanbacteria bacterium]
MSFLHARETAFVPFRIKPGHSLSLDAVFIAGCEVQFKIFPPKQINKNTGYPMNGAKEIALITGRHDRKGDTRFIKAVHFVGAKNLGPLEEDWLTAWTDIQPNPQCFSSWLRVTVGEKE